MDAVEFSIFLGSSAFIAVVVFVMGILALELKEKSARWFGIMMIVIAIWSFSIAGGMLSSTVQISVRWATGMIFGFSFAPVAFLLFVINFTGMEDRFQWWKIVLVLITPVLTLILYLLPAWRNLIIEEVIYIQHSGYIVNVDWNFGPLFPIVFVSAVLNLLIADVYLLRYALQWSRSARGKMVLVIIATSAPLFTCIAMAINLFPNIKGNLNVFGFSIMGILMGVVIFIGRILKLRPIAAQQLMNDMQDPLLVFDHEWNLVECNPASERVFGECQGNLSTKQLIQTVKGSTDDKTSTCHQRFVYRKEDEELHFDVSISPLIARGNTVGFSLLLRDVTELINSMNQLEMMATTDPLTGLFNRRYYHLEGERLYEQSIRYHHPICAMVLDIDRFKEINDQFGHAAGDQVLIQVAELIRSTVRKVDIAARFGGDEFIVLLPESTAEIGVILAERLQDCLNTTFFDLEGTPIQISFSFGIASCQPGEGHMPSLDELVREADLKLYEAKHEGRNQIRSIAF